MPAAAFDNENQILFKSSSTADVLMQLIGNYRFRGEDILPDYKCFDIFKDGVGVIVVDIEKYPKHLSKV